MQESCTNKQTACGAQQTPEAEETQYKGIRRQPLNLLNEEKKIRKYKYISFMNSTPNLKKHCYLLQCMHASPIATTDNTRCRFNRILLILHKRQRPTA